MRRLRGIGAQDSCTKDEFPSSRPKRDGRHEHEYGELAADDDAVHGHDARAAADAGHACRLSNL